ncbi:MAG: hybrid sensor histidine kinase/response regulator [Pirellulales bacterium]
METPEPEFLEEMRKLFAIEAEENLQTIASGLIEIEKEEDPDRRQAATESVYRAAHNLKGAVRTMNLPGIGAVCQSAESVFSAMKKGALTPLEADFDVLHRAVDSIVRMLASGTGEHDAQVSQLIEELERIAASGKMVLSATSGPQERGVKGDRPLFADTKTGTVPQSPPPAPAAKQATAVAPAGPASADTVRIATAKLDAILLQAEELISVKLAADQRIAELAEALAVFRPWKKEWEKAEARARAASRRQKTRPAEHAAIPPGAGPSHPADPFDGGLARTRELEARLGGLLASLRSDRRAMGTLVNQLLEGAKTVLMLPFATLLRTFPKMVRDISREQNKEVDLVFNGEDIEIDKRILERMKEPLIHLLRNSIDHGLETPDVRRARNKAPGGTIRVDVSQAEGNQVQILVSDDGAGIDPAKLREAAVRRGVLSREEAGALDDQAALTLLFQSGVSTSSLITDISGRGLGMAIVQEAVDKLGGRITLDTRKGEGTTFRISLPLTLATFHGMLLEEYGQLFAVPTSSVERALRVKREDVRTVENRETITVNGTPLSLVRLGAALGLAQAADGTKDRPLLCVIVLNTGQQRMAFSVDSLLREQEILIKNLGKQLARVRNIAGATVLGSGKVVPVLNVTDLFKSAVRAGRASSAPRAVKPETQRKAILVAEDSIASRTLLKNILASSGFDVHTAVDGVEAWTALKERPFNAVVSDVEMPRMNGFDLTAKIRGDGKLAELPVVLVTSLESREDRERGMEAGANAYILKSSFDQSNLLEVVRQLT